MNAKLEIQWKGKFEGIVDFSHKVLDTLNRNKLSVTFITSLQHGLFGEKIFKRIAKFLSTPATPSHPTIIDFCYNLQETRKSIF